MYKFYLVAPKYSHVRSWTTLCWIRSSAQGREETIWIDWPAYPHYQAPEDFTPIKLDGRHLYYSNTFESVASAMESGMITAENVARQTAAGIQLDGWLSLLKD